MLAKDIMTTEVITINETAKIYELTKILAEHKISGVPVCDADGNVVGIVTAADLRTMSKGERIKDIMSKVVVSIEPNTPLEEIAAILNTYKIKRVPVFENGQLVGVVSRDDIVVAIANRRE